MGFHLTSAIVLSTSYLDRNHGRFLSTGYLNRNCRRYLSTGYLDRNYRSDLSTGYLNRYYRHYCLCFRVSIFLVLELQHQLLGNIWGQGVLSNNSKNK